MEKIWLTNKITGVLKQRDPVFRRVVVTEILSIINDVKRRFSRGANRAEALHKVQDEKTTEAITKHLMVLSCKAGCNNCCHQPVILSNDEMDLIESKVDLSTLDKIKMEKQRDFTEDDWKHRPKSETACVFLKDNACSIYDVRPATCRACVYTGDPEHCLPSVGKSSIIMEAEVVASATNNISEPDLIPVKILKRLMSKSEYL